MAVFQIKKGRDLRLQGAADKKIVDIPLPKKVGIYPADFRGLKPQLLIKEGDPVKAGTPLFCDRAFPEIKIASPVSGKVSAIHRGEKRALLDITIETDDKNDVVVFESFSKTEIPSLSKEKITKLLLEGGLWPAIRQRPFSKIAHPADEPKAIFVQGMNTEPLAPDLDFILESKEDLFQTGLDILKRLTKGAVHVCISDKAQSKALTQAQGVQIHQFSGPHPAGNVSTHIHHVDPIHKGEVVWYVGAQDVLRIGFLFLNGVHLGKKVVAVTGESAKNRYYASTVMGTPLSALLAGSTLEGARCISGSVLTGKNVGEKGFLGFYDSQVTAIPEGGKREFLGWLSPGFNKYSFSKTFVSSFLPPKPASLDTDKNGSDRAIVFNHIYDDLVPLDILTFFLLRAVISGDIEEAEKLGILECDEEDFALCSFACPSKTDVGGIIRQGLDLIEKEG